MTPFIWNLLTEPVIRVAAEAEEARRLSLPGVLAGLSRAGHAAYPGLMPHQAHAWYAFLVQLSALSLVNAGRESPDLPVEEAVWRDLLRVLTENCRDDSPWHLVVPDLSKPAFMQPPVPEGTIEAFGPPVTTPDAIDMLPTSKNHDVKAARIVHPEADHWIYALVSLQTMQGYLGNGNWGISRMNGGFASRPGLGIDPGGGIGARFRRDVCALLDERDTLLDAYSHYARSRGRALLWLDPWDGVGSIEPRQLDPYYIEVCRRVRLVEADGHLVARTKASKDARVAAKDLRGNTGDPWTPVSAKGTALTVSESGFTYDLLRKVMFSSDFRPALAQQVRRQDPQLGLTLVATVMVRGQGTTAGLHRRQVPIPREARSWLVTEEGRDRLAHWARRMVEDADAAWRRALRRAILALLQGGPERLRLKADVPRQWSRRFGSLVDEAFFPTLWALAPEPPDGAGLLHWHRRLAGVARTVLREAEEALPVPLAKRYRAFAAADRILEGSLRRHFPDLTDGPTQGESADEHS